MVSKNWAEGNSERQRNARAHYTAVAEALLVTVLWSSSWVIIKFGLEEIPPIIFSGLRYSIASLILVGVILLKSEYRTSLRNQGKGYWGKIALYGLIFVAVTQGAQYVGLFLLDAITVSMLLNLTPIVVLPLGMIITKEVPSRRQAILVFFVVAGAMIYFYPIHLNISQIFGLIVVLIGVLANAISSIMGRSINKQRASPPVVVTGVSMGIGSIAMLVTGFALENMASLSLLSVIYILWLAVVNTAFAFSLWNRAMQTLRAVDIALINSTMLPQIVVLSIVFLGEMPDFLDWIGLVILGFCVALIQILQARHIRNQME